MQPRFIESFHRGGLKNDVFHIGKVHSLVARAPNSNGGVHVEPTRVEPKAALLVKRKPVDVEVVQKRRCPWRVCQVMRDENYLTEVGGAGVTRG